MSRAEFIATFILANYQMMGIDQVIKDANIAADAIYGGTA